MKTNKVIIGIRGALQAGKDTTGQFIISRLRSEDIDARRRPFALNLKEVVAQIFGFDPDHVLSEEFKREATNVYPLEDYDTAFDPDHALTGRELLQYFGTEICRNMDGDCWARGPINYFKQNGVEVGVITDLRFPNEVRVIRDSGVPSFIIKIERPGYEGDGHASERALDNYEGDDFIIVNDGTLNDLANSVDTILKIIAERVNL